MVYTHMYNANKYYTYNANMLHYDITLNYVK